jgi:uncharacterized membrane protein
MDIHNILEWMNLFIEILGVTIIFWGVVMWVVRAVRWYKKRNGKHIYTEIREEIGHSILLGLEVLIAVDIIKTVTTELTLESTLTLGLIVLIRTILSISLQVEIEQRFPWQKAENLTPEKEKLP